VVRGHLFTVSDTFSEPLLSPIVRLLKPAPGLDGWESVAQIGQRKGALPIAAVGCAD